MKPFTPHHENASAASLGVVRATVFALWLFLFLRDGVQGLQLPPGCFIPRGVVHLLPDPALAWLISPAGYATLPWVFIPCVAAAALGLRPYRLWAPLALLAILWFECRNKGFSSYVYHGHTLALLMAAVLVFAPAADAFAIRLGKSPRPRPSAAYRFPLLVVLSAGLTWYAFIAVHRFTHGGYTVFQGEALRSWLLVRSQEPADNTFRFGVVVANSPLLFGVYKFGFLASTVMEVLAPLCLRSWRFSLGWLLFITVFHVLSLFSLQIFFWENTLMLWLLLAPIGLWMRPASAPAHPGRIN